MLDSFFDDQKFICDYFVNALSKDCVSHAYLFNCNNYDKSFLFVLAVVKYLNCPKKCCSLSDECKNCNLCNRIDTFNYPELIIIDADGQSIKKSQIVDLKENLMLAPVEGKRCFYIINNADKMNVQTSNSLLKFLEEPDNNIIAFLLTNKINMILPTIRSRCQIFNLQKKVISYDTLALNFRSLYSALNGDESIEEEHVKFVSFMLKFIEYFEKNKYLSISLSKNKWHSVVNNRDSFSKALDFLISFYFDVLNYISIKKVVFAVDKLDLVKFVADSNDYNKIIDKILVCIKFRDDFVYNPNLNLYFDYLILEMSGYSV